MKGKEERGEASFGVSGRERGRERPLVGGEVMRFEGDPQGDDTKGGDQGSVCSTKRVWH